jgi:peptidoglycan/xylan/chitin deacetylase (PgdA/CDA1 family)
MQESGILTFSLDFELFWGVRDHRTIKSYGKNIENVHKVIPRLLQLFTEFGVHCTWATVGFIFCKNKEELTSCIPSTKPDYANRSFDQYEYISKSIIDPKYHFSPELIDLILQTPGQELGTHTFSHYYTLEEGTDTGSFEADIIQAKLMAEEKGATLQSIVFPRNQYHTDFLLCCKKHGIDVYRGTENSWLYHTRSRTDEKRARRAIRLIDSYINISGHHTFRADSCKEENDMWNIPSSRFLRPYSKRMQLFDKLKLQRIKKSMLHAAIKKEIFHLWFHPHNFGSDMEENFDFLGSVLAYYQHIQKKYSFASLNMAEIKKNYG